MADRSKIEWTDSTWSPVTGCTKVSPGCDHCYAERVTERFHGKGSFENVVLHEDRLAQPLRWRKPRRVFVNSMSDLFHDDVPDEFIVRVFDVMQNAPRHTFQVLTKRHARMRSFVTRYLSGEFVRDPSSGPLASTVDRPPRGIWLGVSVEDQKWADIRVPALLATPAAVRFLSCEPLLGQIDLHDCGGVDAIERDWAGGLGGGTGAPHPLIDWVIVGGESGPRARPMDPAWVRVLRDQCLSAIDVAFFVKQMGSVWAKSNGADPKGGNWNLWPADLRIRELPEYPEASHG